MNIQKDWGLVLAGGGGKGAYEIGAWKAIMERKDLKISAVSGTSVGALNAALFSTGNYEKAKSIWEKQVNEDVILTSRILKQKEFLSTLEDNLKENKEWGIKMSELQRMQGSSGAFLKAFAGEKAVFHVLENILGKPFAISATLLVENLAKRGAFTREGLNRIIRQNEILPEVSNSTISCFATCYNIMNQSVEYFLLQKHSEEEMLKILLASSALPFIFPPEEINGIKYWDGGVKDNVPVRPLYEAGYRKLLVLHLSLVDYDLFSEQASLFKQIQYSPAIEDYIYYRDAVLVHIYLQKSLFDFKGTLDFHPKTIQKKINQGYLETKKRLERVDFNAF